MELLNKFLIISIFYDDIAASVSGHRDIAIELLQRGADINAQDKDGKTATMLAVLNNHHALLEVLLKKRADLTMKNEVQRKFFIIIQDR